MSDPSGAPEKTVAGYCEPFSVDPGGRVALKVGSLAEVEATVEVRRLVCGDPYTGFDERPVERRGFPLRCGWRPRRSGRAPSPSSRTGPQRRLDPVGHQRAGAGRPAGPRPGSGAVGNVERQRWLRALPRRRRRARIPGGRPRGHDRGVAASQPLVRAYGRLRPGHQRAAGRPDSAAQPCARRRARRSRRRGHASPWNATCCWRVGRCSFAAWWGADGHPAAHFDGRLENPVLDGVGAGISAGKWARPRWRTPAVPAGICRPTNARPGR